MFGERLPLRWRSVELTPAYLTEQLAESKATHSIRGFAEQAA
jgi:hypothetical protein